MAVKYVTLGTEHGTGKTALVLGKDKSYAEHKEHFKKIAPNEVHPRFSLVEIVPVDDTRTTKFISPAQAKEIADAKASAEAEAKAKAEAEAKKKADAEAEQKAKAEAEAKAREDAARKADEAAAKARAEAKQSKNPAK